MNLTMTPDQAIRTGFWVGFAVHDIGIAFAQDWLGLEGYLTMVVQNWADIHWAVWIPFLVLGFLFWCAPSWWCVFIRRFIDNLMNPGGAK